MCKFCAATLQYIGLKSSKCLSKFVSLSFSRMNFQSVVFIAPSSGRLGLYICGITSSFVFSTILLFFLHSFSHCSSFLGQMTTIFKISPQKTTCHIKILMAMTVYTISVSILAKHKKQSLSWVGKYIIQPYYSPNNTDPTHFIPLPIQVFSEPVIARLLMVTVGDWYLHE